MSPGWTFLSTHGHVLLAVADDPRARVVDVATRVGITPRATLTVLDDLERAGYVRRTRVGRRTHYAVDGDRPMRHPATAHRPVGDLLHLLGGGRPRTAEEVP